MNGRIARVLLWTGFLVLFSGILFAEEHWVYRHDGSGNGYDVASDVAVDPDGRVYAVGSCLEFGTGFDFVVVNLTVSGDERWIYRYNDPANGDDGANSIAVGTDGNIYAAGMSDGGGTSEDFTVVSLTASGGERWVYRYDGPASKWDRAYSIVTGSDGNIYAAGWTEGSGTSDDFTVVSLTDSGGERWVYRYNGPANDRDGAYSIVMKHAGDGA